MFKIVTTWNFTCPNMELQDRVKNVTLRGYNELSHLTGEFALKIANEEIRALSVSDISDFICPARRDLYYKKGKNRPSEQREGQKKWGNVAGRVVENFVVDLFCKSHKGEESTYSDVIENTGKISDEFRYNNSDDFDELCKLKSEPTEDPDWLIKLLNCNARVELGLKLLHQKMLGNSSGIDLDDLRTHQNKSLIIQPNPIKIGISKGVEPDFIIGRPDAPDAIGDIKSGVGGFQDRYLLTCAGYALAYENEHRQDVNFGVVYFLPTRHSKYAQPISFFQVYILPIDDNLRQYFIDIRNEAYSIISKEDMPDFPDDKKHCASCRFFEKCEAEGLKI